MKGIVFREFLEMVEAKFSADTVDDLIEKVNPPSGGAYTTVGTYDYQELVDLVVALSAETQIPVPTLVQTFGHHLAAVFAQKFSVFFAQSATLFDFLKSVHNHIHQEVLKLYPDAELPSFSHDEPRTDQLTLHYTSKRALAHLALGLIEGSAAHYREAIHIAMNDQSSDTLTCVDFIITRLPNP